MRKILITLILLFSGVSIALAQEKETTSKEIPVPIISYSQKVEIIVPLKKDPNALSLSINQDDKDIELLVTASNNCTVEMAKRLGLALLMKTKTVTLDDPAGKDIPGKGLYNYNIKVIRTSGKTIVEGIKPSDKEDIEWF